MNAHERPNRLAKAGFLAPLLLIGVACQQMTTPASTATPTPPAPATVTIYLPLFREQGVEFVPVKRAIPKADELDMARSALAQLIQGPSDAEKAQGLSGPIPPGVRFLGLRLEGGVAYPNFSKEIEVGGSVRVMTISQSVRRTLREFLGIKEVVIEVEGKTEGVLQP